MTRRYDACLPEPRKTGAHLNVRGSSIDRDSPGAGLMVFGGPGSIERTAGLAVTCALREIGKQKTSISADAMIFFIAPPCR
jgi:hypothetical protein